MEDYRQKITYKILLEVIAIAALLWAFYPWLCYDSIDFPAQVDGWGGRSSLLRMPSIALLFYIGLSVLQKFPEIYNYSCEVTEENEDYLYRMGVSLVRYLKIILVFIFAYRNNDMYAEAMGKAFAHSNLVIILSIAVLFLIITIYAIKMKRYKPKTQQIMKNHQKTSAYDKILEVIAVVALLWAFYPLLYYYNIDSNAEFPIHYNIFGEADNWSGRSSLLIMPLIALLFYVLLSVSQILARKFPSFCRYPCEETEQNADYLNRMSVQFLRSIKIIFVFIMAYGANEMYAGAMGKFFVHSGLVYILSIVGIISLAIIYTVKMKRYKPSKNNKL